MSDLQTPAWIDDIRWNDQGLVPCIVQNSATSDVLMMAWMNRDSLTQSLQQGETVFYSRSREELWHKGATSGNRQKINSLHLDCDGDTLLALVSPVAGGACHLGTESCWDVPEGQPTRSTGDGQARTTFSEVLHVIAERDRTRPEDSYTTSLLEGGVDRAGKKVGEEATEVVIAAKNAVNGEGTAELAEESADLLFHLGVLWRSAGIELKEISDALRRRR